MTRIAIVLTALLIAGSVAGKLPPPSEEAKVQAAESAAKAAWTDKVAQYQLCLAIDRTAETYRKNQEAAGKDVAPALPMPPCADPGPYVSAGETLAAKPLEASGAHSPPEAAVSPPAGNATSAEVAGGIKR